MKARAKRIYNGDIIEYDLNEMFKHVIDPTTIEHEVNGEWMSEGAISERLEENARLRAEVADWKDIAKVEINKVEALQQANCDLKAQVERLKKQSGIMTDDMLDQFDKP
jgi:hypothetical protein